MRRIHLLSTVLGTVLLASPALAQRDSMSDMNRGMGSSSSVPMQNRSAGMADDMGANSATQWFKEAQDALRRGQTSQASEMLERAETRLLSRSLMGSGEQASQGPVVRHSAAARQALMQRDRSTAMREIDMAMNASRDMQGGGMSQSSSAMPQSSGFNSGSMATGSSSANQPMESSGPSLGRSARGQSGMQVQPGPAPGSATARDHGMGGSSMSRADLIILAQGGGGGGGGGDTGAAETGYPGSPAAGASSIPQNPGSSTQGTAVPAVPTEGRGPPVPGANRPATPGTGNSGPAPMPGGGTTPMR